MKKKERLSIVFNVVENLGPVGFHSLLNHFRNAFAFAFAMNALIACAWFASSSSPMSCCCILANGLTVFFRCYSCIVFLLFESRNLKWVYIFRLFSNRCRYAVIVVLFLFLSVCFFHIYFECMCFFFSPYFRVYTFFFFFWLAVETV